MKTTTSLTTLVAIAIALLGAPTAGADDPAPAPGVAQAQSGSKDYSKNAATGDHMPDLRYRMGTSSLAGTTSASTAGTPRSSSPGAPATGRAPAGPVGDATPWTNLAFGLVGACLGAGGAAIAGRARRRSRHARVVA